MSPVIPTLLAFCGTLLALPPGRTAVSIVVTDFHSINLCKEIS